ncbi:MAG: Na+/H+ antiporter NhaC [Cyclobacteriaceae bacterium]|nr:Na+/H+ antiporter NhaC [Cyclobacteriaceae bacterium]
MAENTRKPTLAEALIPITFLIVLLSINVTIFGDAALDGSNQIVLILSGAVAGLIAFRFGISWKTLQRGILHSINSAMSSILILLLIGSLAGAWMISGIVPAMVYYGLKILNPTILLFASCVVCALVSLATGSSWTTIATVGLALIGIGKAMGMSEGIIAGAIISGAYFGDKMSPLSDTTNLAPAMAGTDLFTHIRYMTLTTVPSLVITLILFLVIGFSYSSGDKIQDIEPILTALSSSFNINLWLFIVPVVVIVLIVKKVPAIPALLAGSLLGILFAVIFQPHIFHEISGITDNPWKSTYIASMKTLYTNVSVVTGNEIVDELLSTGGMAGMLGTIWLILSAMVFGGIMDASGMLKRITEVIISVVNSTGSLITSTAASCVFFNITASDQYLAIVVPGKMFEKIYRERGLAPQNLSRTLEDSGTVTSVLIPWNTCGAAQSNVLGVATFTYLPYCFFNIISPFMTVFFAYAGIKIAQLKGKSDNEIG